MPRVFRICKNISSIPSGTHATPIFVIFGTSCRVLATVPNRIRNFDFFFSECIPWTHTQLLVPQTWSSVKLLDHKKAYKTVPLQILLSVHLTRQYCRRQRNLKRIMKLDSDCGPTTEPQEMIVVPTRPV